MKFKLSILAGVVMLLFSSSVNSDTLTIREDGTAFIKGVVIGHISGCEVDGTCSLIVRVDKQKVSLIYAQGDTECANTQAAWWVKWGENVSVGSTVRAYGAYSNTKDNASVRFCDSVDYFLIGEDDLLPERYTEKYFDEKL